jgi:hypothetical protein
MTKDYSDKRTRAIDLARDGNKNSAIAKRLGFSPRTLNRWLIEGRSPQCSDPDLANFAIQFDAARAEHEVGLVSTLNALGDSGELAAVQYLAKQVHGWGDSAVGERVVERFLDYLQGELDPTQFSKIVHDIAQGALDD